MTIKTRNYCTLILFFCAVAALLTNVILLAYAISTGQFTPPDLPQQRMLWHLYSNRYTFISAFISLFLLQLYGAAISLYFVIAFEKTQSTEIVFLLLFVIGCLLEGVRVLIPLFNLWHSYSSLTQICGRAVLFGRTLNPLALLAVAIASGPDQRQNIERNIMLLLGTATVAAALLPIDITHVSPQGFFPWGNGTSLSIARMLIILAAIISQFVSAFWADKLFRLTVGFAALAIGYVVTCGIFSITTLVIGIALLGGGSVYYVQQLHRHYLWQ
ncbi:MAG: hypothetical protein IJ191_00655 [Treponema sp.]|nr:hypothetical protein [Treponema sp.]